MRINAIVTDLDDTLLNGDSEISPYTLRVMHECVRRGIRLIPASGRAQASMEPFARALDTGSPYIACNGAQLVNADHTVAETITMPASLAREICGFLEQNGFYVQAYRNEAFYYAKECEPAINYKKSSGMKGVAVGDLYAFLTFPVPKLLSVNHPSEVARLYPIARELYKGQATFTVSKPYFLEVEPLGATKGEALQRLAARIGLEPQATLAFGDSLNDISMLSFTPNSVAMGNARPEVKAAAAYVCGANTEDGLARFVQEYVLNANA